MDEGGSSELKPAGEVTETDVDSLLGPTTIQSAELHSVSNDIVKKIRSLMVPRGEEAATIAAQSSAVEALKSEMKKIQNEEELERIQSEIAGLELAKQASDWVRFAQNARMVQARINDAQVLNLQITETMKALRDESQRLMDRTGENYFKHMVDQLNHEIRTPLSQIRVAIDLLMEVEGVPGPALELACMIIDSTDHLLNLVNFALETSWAKSSTQLMASRFDLHSLLHSVIGNCTLNTAQTVLMSYDPTLPLGIKGSATHFYQIALNLLTNAMKFTDLETGAVFIQVTQGELDTNYFQIKVTDNGKGISAENQDCIFTDFQQGEEDTKTKFGGFGLGLSICRSIVTGFGGSISVHSPVVEYLDPEDAEVGCAGTEFVVRVPRHMLCQEEKAMGVPGNCACLCTGAIKRAITASLTGGDVKEMSRAVISERAEISSPHQHLRILVVDDCIITQKLLARALNLISLNTALVEVASSGIDIEKIIASNPPFDLLIVDAVIPGRDGPEIVRWVREQQIKNKNGNLVPIIGVSASLEYTMKLLKSGANDVMVKPFSKGTIETKLVSLGLLKHRTE